jgi:hypothetical protein
MTTAQMSHGRSLPVCSRFGALNFGANLPLLRSKRKPLCRAKALILTPEELSGARKHPAANPFI